MRIFFLILFLTFSVAGFSQDDKQPTQKEIEAQKQEAIKEAKQQVADLKEEIAEAKAKGEDPESIKEMEKQLATLQNMVAMLEKTNLSAKPKSATQPVKTVEPKYVSPFTPILLKQPVSIPTETEANNYLLWYKGKKIDANTLITNTGLIVRYDRVNYRLTLQPDKKLDTAYYGLINTLGLTDKMKNQFVDGMDQMENSFFMYPVIDQAYQEYEFFKTRYFGLAKNVIELAKPAHTASIDVLVNELANYMYNLKPVQQVLPPPERPDDLCICDFADKRKEYEEALDDWLTSFFKEETRILALVAEIHANLDFIEQKKMPKPYVPDNILRPEPYAVILLERSKARVAELLKKYENGEILLEDGLICATVKLAQFLNTLDDSEPQFRHIRKAIRDLIRQIKTAVYSNLFQQYIETQKQSRNFSFVFNHSLYLGHELNKKIMEYSYEVDPNFFKNWMKPLEDYNRFTLQITIDFEYQMDPGGNEPLMNAKGTFQSDKMIVSLGVEECMFNLRITDANYRNKNTEEEKFKIPLKVTKGAKEYVNQTPIPYTGPATAVMIFPRFKLNFCNLESEVKLDLLTYKKSEIQKHIGDDPKKVFTTDMLAYANKMFLSLVETHSNLEDLVKSAGDMISMSNSPLQFTTHNPKMDQMKMDYLMNKKRYDMQYHMAATTHTEKTIVPLGKLNSNGSATIIYPKPKNIVDPNDKDRVVKVDHAIITLELTHTPK